MKSGSMLLALGLLLTLLSGCASTKHDRAVTTGVRAAPPARTPIQAVVFCADGAGGFGGTTDALRAALGECSPIHVELVDWSHGRGRMLSDHLHYCNIVRQSKRLAEDVQAVRARRPDLPIHLVGHSAGCAVVLMAADELPRGTIDHIVLLAPSVSACYDLRPSLASTRLGIHAFTSTADVVLAINMPLSGTTDRRWGATAGRVGFKPIVNCPEDRVLYARLFQHPWDPSQAELGHNGGHYGSFKPPYLRSVILPLLTVGTDVRTEQLARQ